MNSTKQHTFKKFHLPLTHITKREIEVLHLVSSGMSSIEIGKQLFVSEETIKSHRKNMRRKLNACNGASLIRAAFDKGILKTS